MMNEYVGSLTQSILGVDAAIGFHSKSKLFVVSFLLYAEVIDLVAYITDRGMNGVDGYGTYRGVRVFVIVGGNISPALADSNFKYQLHRLIHITDNKVGVKHLEMVEELIDIAGGEGFLTSDHYTCCFLVHIGSLTFKAYLLQIEDDVGNIFNHSIDSRKLMLHSFNFDGSDSIALEGAQQHAAKSIPDGNAVSWFQGAKLKHSLVIINVEHEYLIGLLK